MSLPSKKQQQQPFRSIVSYVYSTLTPESHLVARPLAVRVRHQEGSHFQHWWYNTCSVQYASILRIELNWIGTLRNSVHSKCIHTHTRNRLARHTPHLSPDCPSQSQVRSNLYSVSSVGLVIFVVDRIQLNFTGVERKEQCRTTVSYSTIDQDTIQSSDPHQLQTHTPYHAISRTPLIS